MKSVFTILIVSFIYLNGFAQTVFGPQQPVNSSPGESFGSATVYSADIDGDGDMDVLSAGQANDIIQWFENDGNGNFTYHFIASGLDGVESVFAIDLDGDNDLDVLSAGPIFNDVVAWYENTDGLGTFSFGGTISNAQGVLWVHAADVDNDDDNDVMVAAFSFGEILLFKNDGSGNFGAEIVISDDTDGAKEVYAADLDGDENIDILAGNVNNGKLTWYKNDGNGNFGAQQIIQDNMRTLTVYAADLDGDDDMDVLAGGDLLFQDKVAWFANDGNGNFGEAILIDDGVVQKVHAADLDNDGDMDVLAAIEDAAVVTWYENDGSGNFGPQNIISADLMNPWGVHAADIDGDDDLDVLSASFSDSKISWYENFLGEEFMTITGQVYWDKDGNDIFSAGDEPFAGLAVNVDPAGFTYYTNNDGVFNAAATDPVSNDVSVDAPLLFDCEGYIDFNLTIPDFQPFPFDYEAYSIVEQDFVFAGIGGDCRSIGGTVFNDQDEDGTFDNDENGLGGILIATDDYGSVFSKSNGDFSVSIPVDEADWVALYLDNTTSSGYCGNAGFTNFTQTFPSGSADYPVTANSGSMDGFDFGVYVEQQNEFDIGLYSLVVQAGVDAGEVFHGWMDFKARGTIVNPCTLRIEHSPLVELLQSDINPTNQTSTSVDWVFSENSVPYWFCMQMDWQLDGAATEGETLHWEATYECPPGTDGCPENNVIIRDVEIFSGPVRMGNGYVQMHSMRPEGVMPEVVNNEAVLSYVIRFQNPLATTAYNITVIDTLPEWLDLATITQPFSSYPGHEFRITDDGVLIWELNGIDLTNSEEDELNSYGFVQFNIALKEGLTEGTIIPNKATILFNGIHPLQTNEVIHRLDNTVPVLDNSYQDMLISLYPNPFRDQTVFELGADLPINFDLYIVDILGNLVRRYENQTDSRITISRGDLPDGIYFLNMHDSENQKPFGVTKMIVGSL